MLDEAQKALLVDLVEADRRGPREKRESFLATEVLNTDFAGAQILHPGWHDRNAMFPSWILRSLL
jgi:hypothetical protein